MPVILNKFREYQVSPNTEVLILGNFSADSPDAPDFFMEERKVSFGIYYRNAGDWILLRKLHSRRKKILCQNIKSILPI